MSKLSEPVWLPNPEAIENSNISRFMDYLGDEGYSGFTEYTSLHRWSVENIEQFWAAIWNFCDVKFSNNYSKIIARGVKFTDAKWFLDARLNFAENLLTAPDPQIAILYFSELGEKQELNFLELRAQVASVAAKLVELGVKPHDRVAGFMPNIPQTIVAMLAASSIGAIWSSCSPDFGSQAVVDRFSQVAPKILFTVDNYSYAGKKHNVIERVSFFIKELPSIEHIILIQNSDKPEDTKINVAISKYDDILKKKAVLSFAQLAFDHPLYILFSSGTTGVPKCITHSAGGALIQHLKEHQLHVDLRPEERIFYYTTCGWMMWNWLVSALASNATLVLYEGSPFFLDHNALWDLADKAKINVFGTSAKYLSSLEKTGAKPKDTHLLSSLRMILSTGSPLLPQSFDYVYRDIKSDLCLGSITGGTDIVSLFAGCNPNLPVYRGEIQSLGLGMKVEVFDEDANSIREKPGELVCTEPFPCAPIYFWGDIDGSKYFNSYFDTYPNVWRHGDWAEITSHNGLIIYGRSDATLNPAGVRIGTAEIYREVEKMDEIMESLAVGQNWNGDVRIILFVVLKNELKLTESLKEKIKIHIKKNTSPRHVPAKIIAISEIPKTVSGKNVELAVKNIIHGREIKNKDALVNPDALLQFKNLAELETD
jgi:acetoacetyl-CoA synthetase